MRDNKLIITVGLPRSGKSSLCKELQAESPNIVIVNPDTIRRVIHGQAFVASAEGFVWATVDVMVKSLLVTGHTVIIDATNTTVARRKKWVSLARESTLYPLTIMYVPTDRATCVDRAEDRVLIDAINRMADYFEPPTYDEGLVKIM